MQLESYVAIFVHNSKVMNLWLTRQLKSLKRKPLRLLPQRIEASRLANNIDWIGRRDLRLLSLRFRQLLLCLWRWANGEPVFRILLLNRSKLRIGLMIASNRLTKSLLPLISHLYNLKAFFLRLLSHRLRWRLGLIQRHPTFTEPHEVLELVPYLLWDFDPARDRYLNVISSCLGRTKPLSNIWQVPKLAIFRGRFRLAIKFTNLIRWDPNFAFGLELRKCL